MCGCMCLLVGVSSVRMLEWVCVCFWVVSRGCERSESPACAGAGVRGGAGEGGGAGDGGWGGRGGGSNGPPPPNPEVGGRGGGGGRRHRKTLVSHGGLSDRGERPPCCSWLLSVPVQFQPQAVPCRRKEERKRRS